VKIIRFLFLVFLIVGCNYNPNNSDYVPPSIIWSTSDEMPSFKDCDEFDLDSERKMCFESKILNMIYSNLDLKEVIVPKKINDTLYLSLLIDNKGKVSLTDSKNIDKLTTYIPNFELLLSQSIEKIPPLFPATKTNIGVPVSTKFKLPLIIKSN